MHRPGIGKRDDERKQLEEERSDLLKERARLLKEYGFSGKRIDDDVKMLLMNRNLLGEDYDKFSEMTTRIDAIEARQQQMAAQDAADYNAEKQQRQNQLQYVPSQDFISFVKDGLDAANNSLTAAAALRHGGLLEPSRESIGDFTAIQDMLTSNVQDNLSRYTVMEDGLYAMQGLKEKYEQDSHGDDGTLALLNEQIIAVNRGMNTVGEAYLDEIDQKEKRYGITPEQRRRAYRDHYQTVIERESFIDIESRSFSEENLVPTDFSTQYNTNLYLYLRDNNIPLYTTEEDAVFAFKREAMPLTLEADKEHSAILDTIEVFDRNTGETETYYFYTGVIQGLETTVFPHALLGAFGDLDRKLLHTHPVRGGWDRNFSGDPADFWGDMGDSNVPRIGYGGTYVVTSAAEVKLYGGLGETDIGSGYNTYANTRSELDYVSTIDLY